MGGLDDAFSTDLLNDGAHGVFRYRKLLPSLVDAHWEEATMAEGGTGIVRLGWGKARMLAKMDYAMPTLSFKDRGAAVLVAAAKGIGIAEVVQDSSGNAGNAIAAYASRLGMACEILVPASTSAHKVTQIKAYGASVRLVPGSREDAARAALQEAESGRYYASHVYNPLFSQGTKTYVYEIWEQLGGNLPDALAVPVGNGTLLMGVYYGVKSLLAGGAVHTLPLVVAVQAARCAPLHRAFGAGLDTVAPVRNEGTVAEGIAVADPRRGSQMLSALRELQGAVVAVDEEAIARVDGRLARSGIFVEPTSAATVAGAEAWAEAVGFEGTMMVPLCGAGLKSVH